MKNTKHFIYKITNIINNKIYIGQTNDPKRRWRGHKNLAKSSNQIIHKAMRKYGVENFNFEILHSDLSWEKVNILEAKLIEKYNCRNNEYGYNIKQGGAWEQTEEAIKKRKDSLNKTYVNKKNAKIKNKDIK